MDKFLEIPYSSKGRFCLMFVTCLALIFFITSAGMIIYMLKLGILIKMSDVAHRPLVLIYVIKGL